MTKESMGILALSRKIIALDSVSDFKYYLMNNLCETI